MQLALLQGFEMGTHGIPFCIESPLCWIFWVVFLLGAGIQYLALRPKRRRAARWILPVILLVGLTACEVGCQVITGWDRLAPIIFYFYLSGMLSGAGGCALAVYLHRRRTK